MSRIMLLRLENHLLQNPCMQMMKKEQTQSIAVSAEEKIAVEVLAIASHMKPATFARHMLFRGLYQFLSDHETHAPALPIQIYSDLIKLIEGDPSLARIKEVVEMKRGLETQPLNAMSARDVVQNLAPATAAEALKAEKARTAKDERTRAEIIAQAADSPRNVQDQRPLIDEAAASRKLRDKTNRGRKKAS